MQFKSLIVLATILVGAMGCNPKYFNLFVGGDVNCSNSDTEGRVAAGGNVNLANYAINCQTYNTDPSTTCIRFGSVHCADHANDEPALVAGGAVNWNNGQVYAGSVVYGTSYTTTGVQVVMDCAVAKKNWGPVVKAGLAALAATSTSYAGYAATGTTTVQYGAITFSTLSRYAIFTVQASDLAVANGVTFSVPNNAKLVLVNVVGGTTASMSNFAINGYTAVKGKIMWNFPTATTLNLANIGIWGAVMAPRAVITAANGVINGQVFGVSYSAGSPYGTCSQINYNPFTGTFPSAPPSPPAAVCGDSIVQVGEDCDGGACCSSTCNFLTSTTVCRPVAGVCDVAETCSGVSSNCPVDAFKPVTTPCGSNFGVCDVQMVEHCPGDAATCKAAPPAYIYSWDAFNVVSFDSYTCHGGDVEGRLAVRNLLDVSGFTIGLKTLSTDPFSYYELVVAQNGTYTDGSINIGQGVNGKAAVGGTFTAPDYLQAQRDTTAYTPTQNFDDAQAYYTTISNKIAGLGANAQAALIYGDGLSLTCNDADSAMYIVQVPTSMFNKVNWYVTSGCKLTAAWLITLTGNDNVNIQGSPFPGIVERVVYNIQGTRSISANNGVAANILAPNANYIQSTGVTYGRVIVGNVTEARQNNKPECLNFASITITQKNLVAVKAGDDFVYVYDLAAYIPGDLICSNGECHKIVSGVVSKDEQGEVVKRAVLATSWSSDRAQYSTLTTVVANPSDSSRAEALPIDDETTSGAAALSVSVVAALAAVMMM